jgi:radical SAM superfamily enzyme YgiQ (UPF0313 family)
VLASVADVIFLGEGETLIPAFSQHYQQQGSKEELLEALAHEPGFFIPSIKQTYPLQVQHWPVADHEPATSFCIPQQAALKMFMIEAGRGCGRGCRFCAAGQAYHPFRFWPVEKILATVERYAQPNDRIGLVGAALSDYPKLDLLCTRLREKGYRLNLSSLRVDRISKPLLQALDQSGLDSLTLAPEAGSERLRRIIGKNLTEEQIFAAVALLAQSEIKSVKLYYMIGLPGEREEDVQALIALTNQISALLAPRRIRVGLSTFIPKPCTAFQWAGLAEENAIREKWKNISRALRHNRLITVSTLHYREDGIQAMLSLGDQALGDRLITAEQAPLLYQDPMVQSWIHQTKEWHTPLPWDMISCGHSKPTLWESWQKSASQAAA